MSIPTNTRESPKLSGSIFLDTIEGYKQIVGSEMVREVLGKLPDDIREQLRVILPSSRVAPDLLMNISEAVAKASGRDMLELHADAIRLGMKRTLKNIWKPLLKLTTDQALFKRTPLFYSRAYEGGSLVATGLENGRGELVLSGWQSGAPAVHVRGICAGIEAVLAFAGRKNVAISYDLTADGAILHLTWDV
jgi:hypothetical protein